jgi:hypothetical protein
MQRWWGANDFINAMRYWDRTLICARKMLKMLPRERYIELRFEDLISNPAKEMKKITDFLEVDFEKKMVDDYFKNAFDKIGDGRIQNFHPNLTKPPQASQAYKWQKTLKPVDQAIAYQIAGNTLVELGYSKGVTNYPLKIFREGYHRLREAYEWRIRKRTKPENLVSQSDEEAYDIFRIFNEKRKPSKDS